MKTKQPQKQWTDQQTKTLIDLFNLGLSATAIAKELGFSDRDAILGKLYRIRRHAIWAQFLTRPADMTKSHKGKKMKA